MSHLGIESFKKEKKFLKKRSLKTKIILEVIKVGRIKDYTE
jgi:hypothetical protein